MASSITFEIEGKKKVSVIGQSISIQVTDVSPPKTEEKPLVPPPRLGPLTETAPSTVDLDKKKCASVTHKGVHCPRFAHGVSDYCTIHHDLGKEAMKPGKAQKKCPATNPKTGAVCSRKLKDGERKMCWQHQHLDDSEDSEGEKAGRKLKDESSDDESEEELEGNVMVQRGQCGITRPDGTRCIFEDVGSGEFVCSFHYHEIMKTHVPARQ